LTFKQVRIIGVAALDPQTVRLHGQINENIVANYFLQYCCDAVQNQLIKMYALYWNVCQIMFTVRVTWHCYIALWGCRSLACVQVCCWCASAASLHGSRSLAWTDERHAR